MTVLDDVKAAMCVTGDHADAALGLHIDTVKAYLRGAGVKEEVVEGPKSTGAIIRGVCDLWNTGSGDVSFSPVFHDLVVQLAVTEQEVD